MARFSTAYLESVARRWQMHYQRANGKRAPNVVWAKGWFTIDGKKYRRRALERMAEELCGRPTFVHDNKTSTSSGA